MILSRRKQVFLKTVQSFKRSLPILLGVLMLLSLASTLVPKNLYGKIFTGNQIIDPLIGALVGSIAGGNPVTSYIIGGELRFQDISMLAITAFIVAWVTVGVIQLPAEALMLGKRFAIIRNVTSFVTALIISIIIVLTLGCI
ncbi:MAG: permease [Desulfobacteraceae bacterium]|nr:permease [Desulfobacteraceae bacterium]